MSVKIVGIGAYVPEKVLTNKEIEYILDFLPKNTDIPCDTSNSILEKIKNNLQTQLKKMNLKKTER